MNSIEMELKAGTTAARAGDSTYATACFQRVLEQEPNNTFAWMGLSRLMQGPEEALECIEQVLRTNPRHSQALEAKAMLQIRMLVDEAAVIEASEPVPSTPARRRLLGEVLTGAGILTADQLEVARRLQARLAEKQPMPRLGEVVVQLKLVQPAQLEAAVAAQISVFSSVFTEHGTELIGAFLVRHAFITLEQLEEGLIRQAELKRRGQSALIGRVLVDCGFLRQDQLDFALITWQHWYKRTTVARDDPYLPSSLPALTTRKGTLQRYLPAWSQWIGLKRRGKQQLT